MNRYEKIIQYFNSMLEDEESSHVKVDDIDTNSINFLIRDSNLPQELYELIIDNLEGYNPRLLGITAYQEDSSIVLILSFEADIGEDEDETPEEELEERRREEKIDADIDASRGK